MSRFELLPHQHEGVALMQEFGHRCVLADDMGLGKTLQLCYALRELGHTGGLPALVVCPASLK